MVFDQKSPVYVFPGLAGGDKQTDRQTESQALQIIGLWLMANLVKQKK